MLKTSVFCKALGAVLVSLYCLPVTAASDPDKIIGASCGGCHAPREGDGWTRISKQRKTPEGWQMTIARMQMAHKAQIVDPDGGDAGAARQALIKYLADTQGLAPEEAAPYRYIIERELNTVEEHRLEEFRQMCARCHSGARTGLQYRTEEEWRNLVHFHLGQFPTTEYQMMGRDRDWKDKALDEMVAYLTEYYPLQTDAWDAWSAADKPSLEGRWRVFGHMPSRGDYSGFMTATAAESDRYKLELQGSFSDGSLLNGSGNAVVYTGFEWRGSLTVDGVSFRQVMAASADGSEMSGRMFERDRNERGLRMSAVREGLKPQLLAVQPAHIAAGSDAVLRIIGTGLKGEVSLGAGLQVVEVISSDGDEVHVKVAAATDAAEGVNSITVGDTVLEDAVTVYRSINRLTVEPAFAIARVGGNGGSQPVVQALFDAVAWSNGTDGEAGTEDDLRIGAVSANWSVEPWNEVAARDEDVRFAGQMDKDTGVFTPAAAGPNPQRKYQTNNAGNLKVVATVGEGEAAVQGSGQMIVTVQRWNNPPIR